MKPAQQLSRGQRLFLASASIVQVVLAAMFGCAALDLGDSARTLCQAICLGTALLAVSILLEDTLVGPARRAWSARRRRVAA